VFLCSRTAELRHAARPNDWSPRTLADTVAAVRRVSCFGSAGANGEALALAVRQLTASSDAAARALVRGSRAEGWTPALSAHLRLQCPLSFTVLVVGYDNERFIFNDTAWALVEVASTRLQG
jgi:hypothetical protein